MLGIIFVSVILFVGALVVVMIAKKWRRHVDSDGEDEARDGPTSQRGQNGSLDAPRQISEEIEGSTQIGMYSFFWQRSCNGLAHTVLLSFFFIGPPSSPMQKTIEDDYFISVKQVLSCL